MNDNGTFELMLKQQLELTGSLAEKRERTLAEARQLHGQALFQQSEAVRFQKQAEVIKDQANNISTQARALLLQELQALKKSLTQIRLHLISLRQNGNQQSYVYWHLIQKNCDKSIAWWRVNGSHDIVLHGHTSCHIGRLSVRKKPSTLVSSTARLADRYKRR